MSKSLDVLEVPTEWAVSIVVPIFTGKGYINNCSCYRATMSLEHGIDME